ncbi:MAG: substrate-binding domain-containing protein [Eubacteriales bacterium]|nr:substrate-binding domain-containing protein [Eubacteriales bacterium]
MGRLEKGIVVSLLLVLVVLGVVILLQSVSPQKDDRTFSISVLVDDLNDYCRRGMDRAALEYNVDVHYISGFGDRGYQQSEYLRREVENGVDAVIMRPVEAQFLSDWIANTHPSLRVVTVGDRLPGHESAVHVSPDNIALGRMLGERILENAGDMPCVILMDKYQPPSADERLEGLLAVLEEAGQSVEAVSLLIKPGAMEAELVNRPPRAVVVLEEELLPQLCTESPETHMLFGVGYVNEVRTALESGRLNTVAVYSAFDEGYISMRQAVELAKMLAVQGVTLNGMLADASNMYLAPQVQVLFPIT